MSSTPKVGSPRGAVAPGASVPDRSADPSGSRLEFRLLGPFQALVDGGPVKLGRRPRALLAALVLHRGESQSTDSLIAAVWDGPPPASAQSVLRVYVSQLRRALPRDLITTDQAGYKLLVGNEDVDADRFERLLADGRRALVAGEPRLAKSLFASGLELWHGEALADFRDEWFARDEAARMNELHLACREGRFDAELALGRHRDIVADLSSLVALHPLREHLRGQLMTALYRSGRQSDALACYREGRAALVAGLGLEPGPELRELERRILAHDPGLAAPATPEAARHGVPPPPTPTIGRAGEVADIRRLLLERRSRLVTLTGPGGIGKTRIAVEVARLLGDELAEGALLIDLAPLTDPEQVLPSIGHALDLRESDASGWLELLVEHLRGRELLLVLDNFEHLVEGAAELAPLLAGAPLLSVLATSRRPLRISAEHLVNVRPLEGADALELLASRATAAGAVIDPDEQILAELCDRLDRLPLAIELAAPWFRTLSPPELLGLLDSRLSSLDDGPRDIPRRHQTMRSTIDWSFDLLEPTAQHLLGRLSFFRRVFAAPAVLRVGGPGTTLAALDELVESSIVHSDSEGLRLLEVVREYAQALPAADDEGARLHATYFLELAEAAEPELVGPDQGTWLTALEQSHDDLRAALEWLRSRGESMLELRLAAALGRFWYIRGYLSEGLEHLVGAVERAGDTSPELTANALRSASALAVLLGDYVQARALVEGALGLYRTLGNASGIVRSLSNLGAVLHGLGELDAAAATLDECVAAAESLGEARLLALARNNRGDVAVSQGDLETARREFEQSLALLRPANDLANIARSLYNLGAVAVKQRRLEAAGDLLVEALDLSNEVDDKEDIAWCLIALAALGALSGRTRDAALVLGFARGLPAEIGATIKPNEQRLHDDVLAQLSTSFHQAERDALLGSGELMASAEVIALARSLGA